MQAQPEKKRHRFKMPSAFTILFIIIIIIDYHCRFKLVHSGREVFDRFQREPDR